MATGGVAASVEPTSLTAQTFDMGTGTNIANVFSASPTDAGGGVINFAGGGTDTVEFHAFQDTDSLLNDNVAGGHNYNNVVGFTNASGTVNLSTGSFVVPSPSQTASGIQLQRVPRRWRPTSAASAKTFQPHTPTTSISTSNRALPGTRRGPVAIYVGIDWRVFGRHEAIRSCGEVNDLIVWFLGEGLPSVDLAHGDLS